MRLPKAVRTERIDVGTALLILEFLIKEEPAIAAAISALFKGKPNGPTDADWEAAFEHFKQPLEVARTKKKGRR